MLERENIQRMEKGFIKLFRNMTEWCWYDDIPTKVLFIHLLIKANWEDKKWHKIIVKRGQLITSQMHLAEEVGLSRQQVRRAINNLISTNEITKSATSTYTIITINNYDKYQDNNQVSNQRTANGQPTDNQRATTTKELKEVKEEDISKDISSKEKSKRKFTPPTVEEVIDYCKQRNNKVDAETFIDFYSSKNWMIGKNKMKDWKACVRTWERREKSSSGANGVKLLPESERDHSLDDVF